jgi:hypothetical protein
MTPDPRIQRIRYALGAAHIAMTDLDSLAADLAERVTMSAYDRVTFDLLKTREALARAIVHVKHMEMPDTGVIGPGGEREKDHHEALLAEEIKTWEAALEGVWLLQERAGRRRRHLGRWQASPPCSVSSLRQDLPEAGVNIGPIPGTHEPGFVEQRIVEGKPGRVRALLPYSRGLRVFDMGECGIILARENPDVRQHRHPGSRLSPVGDRGPARAVA